MSKFILLVLVCAGLHSSAKAESGICEESGQTKALHLIQKDATRAKVTLTDKETDTEDPPSYVVDNNHGSPAGCNQPLQDWFKQTYKDATSIEVLDVGGGWGALRDLMKPVVPNTELNWECVDVVANGMCTQFDGNTLQQTNASKDLVVFNYVLHHAGEHTISLLRHAKRVSRR